MIYLKYILYWFITQDARLRHATAKDKGYYCESLSHGSIGTKICYDPNRPVSDNADEYLTWAEFKNIHSKE